MSQPIKITIFALFSFLSINCLNAQEAVNTAPDKVIVWSKIENDYQVQLIREHGAEYILRTPLHLVDLQNQQENLANTNANVEVIRQPMEFQTNELIQSRMSYANVGMPLTFNDSVRKEVDRLLVNRETIELALGRSQYFLNLYDNTIINYGAPRALRYLPLVESSYKPTSHSRAGAKGIWQFMKGTARLYGLPVNNSVDSRLDPIRASDAAIRFLTDLYEDFGDWELVLASYNAGPGRVRRAINASGLENPTFWEIKHLLPRETRRYVPKFMAAVYVMENASQIGLIANQEGYKKVETQVAELQKANFKPSVGTYYASKSIIPNHSTPLKYTVKSGDNLGFIAEWYDVKASQLRGWNGISGNMIKVGQAIKVYVPKAKVHVYKDINRLSFAQKQRDGGDSKKMESKTLTAKLSNNYVVYQVKSGDTLWSISRNNGVALEQILQLNNISNSRNLKPGMILKIREKS